MGSMGTLTKTAAASALSVVAKTLQTAASVAEASAHTLRPADRGDGDQASTPGIDTVVEPGRPAAVRDKPDEPDLQTASMPAASQVARSLSPERQRPSSAGESTGSTTAEPSAGRPPEQQPTATPASERVADAPTRMAELAERPAQQVLARIETMSTDELRHLLEHERANKQRKTVIEAVEKAVDQHARG